ncbi:hypothetical protein GCM10009839_64460 [Catenulispora yoronensis]|uniref:Gram-positive cocci surface proteins LPxTG domain-containing protein n=1 Tax=Catenulispora yoronensis TaxID=450799 RepID=A0ABP5GNK7_9ACTN
MRTVLHRCLASAAATAAVCSIAGVAVAAVGDYPLTSGSLIPLSATTGLTPGGGLPIEGLGFAPGASVALTFFSTPQSLGSVTADATGEFKLTVKIPVAAAPGTHTIQAVGPAAAGGTLDLSLTITIGNALPRTGTDIETPLGIGIGAVAAGGLALAVARRRTAA